MSSLLERILYGRSLAERREEELHALQGRGGAKRGGKKAKEIAATQQMSRRALLRRGALALGIGGLGAGTGISLMTPRQKATSSFNELTGEIPSEITLGNVHFYRQVDMDVDPIKWRGFLENLQRAYERLSEIFGEEMVTLEEWVECEISITDDPHVGAEVKGTADVKTDMEGNPYVEHSSQFRIERMVVGDFTEATLAHELFHIFIQRGILFSESFTEGHAHAFQGLYYEMSPYIAEELRDMEKPAVRRLIEVGLDHEGHGFNEIASKRTTLWLYFQAYQVSAWKKFFEEHPLFMKDFYRALYEQSKSGKASFNKKELMELALSIEPNFENFYQENPGLKMVGESGPQEVMRAVQDAPGHKLFLAGYKTSEKQVTVEGPGTISLRRATLQPFNNAAGVVTVHAAGKARVSIEVDKIGLIVLDEGSIPKDVLEDPSLEVWYGDIQIPVEKIQF